MVHASCTAAVLTAVTAMGSARASGPPVTLEGCLDLSGPRISSLLVLEHPELADAPDLRVALSCEDERVVITIEDGLTNKKVERSVEVPAAGPPGREREIALATSSLIVASYLELFVPPDRVHPPLTSPSEEADAAKTMVAETLAPAFATTIQGDAGIRWRNLPEATPTLSIGLRVGTTVHRRWEVFGRATFDIGRATRQRGQVTGLAAMLGGGLAWHSPPREHVGLALFAGLAGGYARLIGRTNSPGIIPGVVDGATGEIDAGLGPEFSFGPVVVALDARGGYLLPNPRGVVTDEADMTLGGFWVGAGLRIGGRLRPRTRAARRATRTPH